MALRDPGLHVISCKISAPDAQMTGASRITSDYYDAQFFCQITRPFSITEPDQLEGEAPGTSVASRVRSDSWSPQKRRVAEQMTKATSVAKKKNLKK